MVYAGSTNYPNNREYTLLPQNRVERPKSIVDVEFVLHKFPDLIN